MFCILFFSLSNAQHATNAHYTRHNTQHKTHNTQNTHSRNYGFLIFTFLLPSVQVILFCLAIGRDPAHLNLAIVNEDIGGNISGHRVSMSDLYIAKLDSTTFDTRFYNSVEQGYNAVHDGKCWGMMHFGQNYTRDLYFRVFANASQAVVEGSRMELTLDMSNQQIAIVMETKIMEAYESLIEGFLEAMPQIQNKTYLLEPPVKMMQPVYGSLHPEFTDFVAPGMMSSIVFAQAVGLTALAFVIENKEGINDR